MVAMAIFNIYYVQRVVTSKVGEQEQRFLRFACSLIELYICEKFQLKRFSTCIHKYMVKIASFNVQRTIALKVGKPELQFINSARFLVKLKTCEVSSKYLKRFLTYRADTSTW